MNYPNACGLYKPKYEPPFLAVVSETKNFARSLDVKVGDIVMIGKVKKFVHGWFVCIDDGGGSWGRIDQDYEYYEEEV